MFGNFVKSSRWLARDGRVEWPWGKGAAVECYEAGAEREEREKGECH